MRPHLAFDQDDLRGLEPVEIAPHHRREIQRGISDAQPGMAAAVATAWPVAVPVASTKRRSGISNEPLADQLQREHRLADADGVDVHRAAGFVFERRGVNRRALAQTRAEASAAQHFHDPTGKRRDEKQRQDEPVESEGYGETHPRENNERAQRSRGLQSVL